MTSRALLLAVPLLAAACSVAMEPDASRHSLRVSTDESNSTTQTTSAPVSSGKALTPKPPAAPPPTTSKGCTGAGKPATGLQTDQTITIAGRQRTYDLEVPASYDPKTAYPLVFVFHGSGGWAAQTRTGFNFAAVAGEKAIFVTPNGINQEWDLNTPADSNQDVALFDTLSATLGDAYCLDPSRTFSTGFSNGAYFSNQLGCRRGDRLRGIASHSGGGPYDTDSAYDANGHLNNCSGPTPAALLVHGDVDIIVTIDKGGDDSAKVWQYLNGCTGGSTPTSPSPCVAYNGCSKPVQYCRISGMGHWLWPAATQKTWDFFASL